MTLSGYISFHKPLLLGQRHLSTKYVRIIFAISESSGILDNLLNRNHECHARATLGHKFSEYSVSCSATKLSD